MTAIPAFFALALVAYVQLIVMVRRLAASRVSRWTHQLGPICVNFLLLLSLVLHCARADGHSGISPAGALAPVFTICIYRMLLAQEPLQPNQR